jgi:hypothetical protein
MIYRSCTHARVSKLLTLTILAPNYISAPTPRDVPTRPPRKRAHTRRPYGTNRMCWWRTKNRLLTYRYNTAASGAMTTIIMRQIKSGEVNRPAACPEPPQVLRRDAPASILTRTRCTRTRYVYMHACMHACMHNK